MRNLALLILVSLFSNSSFADDAFYVVPVSRKEIKIMSYNVQNLFDAEHDEDKEDYQFLPKSSPYKKNCSAGNQRPSTNRPNIAILTAAFDACTDTDWTAEKVGWKIDQIQFAINTQGDVPDILILSEVENPNVVNLVAKALKYDGFYMTNSPDPRGIDLAVLFKEDKLQPLDFVEKEVVGVNKPTRNASSAHFKLNSDFGNEILGVYPIHWPSQMGPTSERIKAANTVRDLITNQKQKFAGLGGRYHAIALGDFNVTDKDNPKPIETVMLDKSWNLKFQDLHATAVQQHHPYIDRMPKGTYYYGTNKEWNHFDHIIFSGDLADGRGLEVDIDSYRINAPLSLSKENDAGERIPFRYNHMSTNKRWLGFSDHYGVHVKLNFK